MIRSNPMFSSVNTTYDNISENQATYSGITIKTLILLGIAGIVGIITGVFLTKTESYAIFGGLLVVGLILEFIAVIIGRSNPNHAGPCGVLYSACEGMVLGTITALANMFYEGVAVLAIGGTIIVFVVCLVMFSCGMMRDTGKLSKAAMILLISILLGMVLTFVCRLLNIGGVATLMADSPAIAIIVTVAFIVYATIMLFLNFNEAAYYVQSGANKDFEWMAAFGFLVSILYIYLEVLRLAMILLDRKN